MAFERWGVVSDAPGNKWILGGAYLWGGGSVWVPPVADELLREADSIATGYVYPPRKGSGE